MSSPRSIRSVSADTSADSLPSRSPSPDNSSTRRSPSVESVQSVHSFHSSQSEDSIRSDSTLIRDLDVTRESNPELLRAHIHYLKRRLDEQQSLYKNVKRVALNSIMQPRTSSSASSSTSSNKRVRHNEASEIERITKHEQRHGNLSYKVVYTDGHTGEVKYTANNPGLRKAVKTYFRTPKRPGGQRPVINKETRDKLRRANFDRKLFYIMNGM
ncbi:unnamed protein product [Sympodiomycopsis kandeliae]